MYGIEYRLFYTDMPHDKESKVIRDIILEKGMARLFSMTNVNELTVDQLVKLQMDKVPTIVVSSTNQITPPQIYDGPQKCSEFINSLILNRRSLQITDVAQRRVAMQQATRNERLKTGGPLDYSEIEMSGVSDSYATLADTSVVESEIVCYGWS